MRIAQAFFFFFSTKASSITEHLKTKSLSLFEKLGIKQERSRGFSEKFISGQSFTDRYRDLYFPNEKAIIVVFETKTEILQLSETI